MRVHASGAQTVIERNARGRGKNSRFKCCRRARGLDGEVCGVIVSDVSQHCLRVGVEVALGVLPLDDALELEAQLPPRLQDVASVPDQGQRRHGACGGRTLRGGRETGLGSGRQRQSGGRGGGWQRGREGDTGEEEREKRDTDRLTRKRIASNNAMHRQHHARAR
eukprot:12607-Rhodomonas_salina.3